MAVNKEVILRLLEESRRGTRIRVYVKPDSNRDALVLEEDELVFYTEEPPVQGRANAALVRFIARALGVNPGKVEIVHGLRDRVKIVEVEGLDPETVAERLAEAAEPW